MGGARRRFLQCPANHIGDVVVADAARQRLRRPVAPPEALKLFAFLVRQLDFHCSVRHHVVG